MLRLGPRSELVLVLAFLAAALAEQFARSDSEHSVLAAVFIVGVCIPLLASRSHPAAATCVTAAVIVAAPDIGKTFPPAIVQILLPPLLAYSCGAHAPARRGLGATVALTAAIQVHVGFSEFPNVEIAIATLPAWWVGLEVRRRRELVRELETRTRQLEAEEETFIELSVQRERARIARDLHDIVSHHLSLMVIQAGAGRLTEPSHANVARARLATIRDAGVQALAETDRLVTLLHPDGSSPPRLAALLERARRDGAQVHFRQPDPELPPAVEAIAYRVVQEALTNAMKHAPGAAIDIDFALDDVGLAITVRNERGAEPSMLAGTGSGLGLPGMGERLAALGGSLDAAREPDGGFCLCARLPFERPVALANET